MKVNWIESKLDESPVCFENGREALNYLDSINSEATGYLVLLDINMPVMNGWRFLEAIAGNSFYERIKVIMVSSSVNTADKKQAKLYPCVIDFLEKPVTSEDCRHIFNLKLFM